MPRTARHPHTRLFLRFRKGDDRAARTLWDHYAPGLRAAARARLAAASLDASAADDAVQSVFLALLKLPIAKLQAIQDPAAYLARAARTAAIDLARTHARNHTRDRSAAIQSAATTVNTNQEAHPSLEAALDQLNPDDRELLALVHVVGLTFEQLASVLDIPRSTAHDRYTAARNRLRQHLQYTDQHADRDTKPADRNPKPAHIEQPHGPTHLQSAPRP